jgi:hypothetical protein
MVGDTWNQNVFNSNRCRIEISFKEATCGSRQQGRQESNPQPPVLETGALPIELHPFNDNTAEPIGSAMRQIFLDPSLICLESFAVREIDYSTILVTTPEPTVLPPSRIAKRTPSSIATVFCNSTVTRTLSPGMHISAPIRLAVPVTSVVRK